MQPGLPQRLWPEDPTEVPDGDEVHLGAVEVGGGTDVGVAWLLLPVLAVDTGECELAPPPEAWGGWASPGSIWWWPRWP